MLRRVETISADPPPAANAAAAAPNEANAAPSGVERRRHPRVRVEVNKDPSPNFERRKQERRSMDALRHEMQWVIAAENQKNRLAFPRFFGLKPSRFFLLLVAVLAGGSAAFLATRGTPDGQLATTQIASIAPVPVAGVPILVAKADIGMGAKLGAQNVAWEEWPKSSLHGNFLTQADNPDAIEKLAGSITRQDIVAGEPILQKKLVQSAPGYLSAVLGGGVRAVSVSVAAEAASGGFLNPGDHVDLVLTRQGGNEVRGGGSVRTDTLLRNVRVLAINTRLDKTSGAANTEGLDTSNFTGQAMATLALDPAQSELVAKAEAMGKLSLVLRSVADFSGVDAGSQNAANQAIRLTSRFWNTN